jgi:hypothetical protein
MTTFTPTTTASFTCNVNFSNSRFALKGASNYTINTSNSNLGLTGFPYTVGFWFKYGSDAGTVIIADLFDFSTTTTVRGITCYHRRDTNKLTVYHGNGGTLAIGNIRAWDFDWTPDLNTWYYITITSTAYNNCNVYVNTTSLGAGTASGTASSATFVGCNFSFFRRFSVTNECNSQYIDEFAIWNRVLSATEVQQVYNASRGKPYFKHLWDGLTSYYRFEEVSGSTLYDSVGSINGTKGATVVLGQAGKNGYGLQDTANNTGSYFASFGNNFEIDESKPITFNGWFMDGNYNFMTYCKNDRPGWYLYKSTSTNMQFAASHTSATYKIVFTTPWTQSIGSWYMITFTSTGNRPLNANDLNVYINGVLQTKSVSQNNLISSISSTIDFLFGDYTNKAYNPTNADEFGVWNRILSQAEVTQLYKNGNGKFY